MSLAEEDMGSDLQNDGLRRVAGLEDVGECFGLNQVGLRDR